MAKEHGRRNCARERKFVNKNKERVQLKIKSAVEDTVIKEEENGVNNISSPIPQSLKMRISKTGKFYSARRGNEK